MSNEEGNYFWSPGAQSSLRRCSSPLLLEPTKWLQVVASQISLGCGVYSLPKIRMADFVWERCRLGYIHTIRKFSGQALYVRNFTSNEWWIWAIPKFCIPDSSGKLLWFFWMPFGNLREPRKITYSVRWESHSSRHFHVYVIICPYPLKVVYMYPFIH